MKTITLGKEKIYEGNLILVNAAHPILHESHPALIPADKDCPDVLLRRDAANILQVVLKNISAGDRIVPVSGYRSAEEQRKIYDDSLKENGADFTRKFVALPNHSEHQTGLAIDLGLKSHHIDFICPDFPYDGICQVFRETAANCGFIQRYTKDKEAITGISHEPWHFRYVGYPHSKIMVEHNLSLEEYIEFIKAYKDDHPLVCGKEQRNCIEVYYVPAIDNRTEITLPENSVYQISGNNADGFVVTNWRKVDEQG
jgi:D-alanyl-D-alanine dipeptidase/carboxypeptidase